MSRYSTTSLALLLNTSYYFSFVIDGFETYSSESATTEYLSPLGVCSLSTIANPKLAPELPRLVLHVDDEDLALAAYLVPRALDGGSGSRGVADQQMGDPLPADDEPTDTLAARARARCASVGASRAR